MMRLRVKMNELGLKWQITEKYGIGNHTVSTLHKWVILSLFTLCFSGRSSLICKEAYENKHAWNQSPWKSSNIESLPIFKICNFIIQL